MKETKCLEFKREITNTFLKTVCAFANFIDGEILFGVDDKGENIGLEDAEKSCIDIENRINDGISPKPDFDLIVDNNIIRLKVHKGRFTPYLYKGKAYRRSDTASVEVNQAELRELVLESMHMSYEELPCRQNDLEFECLEVKMKSILDVEKISEDIIRTLGFVTAKKEYNNAAAVFADKNSFCGIDIARFGDSINEMMERETIQGKSVLLLYDKAIEYFRRYYQYEKIEGFYRKTIELIPERAFREALANALVHRDWSVNSHIRISMYKDKVEINSPGGLPRGISADEYLNGEISSLRNPIIGNVFLRLHYIEMFGTGIKRIINAYSDSDLKPKFRITNNVISVLLPIPGKPVDISNDEKKVFDVIKEKSTASTSEIVRETGFNKSKVIRIIKPLLEKKYIKQTGKGRSTRYSRCSYHSHNCTVQTHQ